MIVFGILGIAFLAFGLYMYLGGAKVMSITPGIPVLMPQMVRNMFIPLGITLIVEAVIMSDLIPNVELRGILFILVVMPMLIITIILGIWNPRWMQPRWLNYLENNYGPGLTRKMLDVAAKNPREWLKRVETQEGLEQWARETCLAMGRKLPVPADESKEEKVRRILRTLDKAKGEEKNSED